MVGEVYVESESEWCQASLIENFQLFKDDRWQIRGTLPYSL